MEVFRRIARKSTQHPIITDGIIAIFLAGLALLNLWINWEYRQPIPLINAIVLTLAVVLPLTLRRRFPLTILLFMTALLSLYRQLDIPEGSFTAYALLIALFSAGAYGNDRWRNWARSLSVVVVAVHLTYLVFFSEGTWSFPANIILSQILVMLLNLFLFGAAWWIGDVWRTRREREIELRESNIQLKYEREENARRAVLNERVRIARELHDVVAHHVSVIGIQAGVARKAMSRWPEKAQEALSLIEISSRQAVNELQRLLGILRSESRTDETAPQPSLQQLDNLIAEVKEAGLQVELIIEGDKRPLPSGVDLSAYRIIQEALTNTIKHAGPATATVTMNYQEDTIELEITDNGRGQIRTEDTIITGTGLLGMKERVNLHRGEFEAGNAPGGGFLVRVKLPLNGITS